MRPSRGGSDKTVPYAIMGGVVVLLIIVAVAVTSANESARRRQAEADAQQNQQAAQRAAQQPFQPQAFAAQQAASAGQSAGRPSTSAPTPRPGGNSIPQFNVAVDRGGRLADNRYLKVQCGKCGAELTQRVKTCPKCSATIRWPEKVKCPFCATDVKVELAAGQSKVGFCAICGGTAKNPHYRETGKLPFGMTRDPLAGEQKCPACKGSGACNHCFGKGVFKVPEYFSR
jgi:hypothetical protein